MRQGMGVGQRRVHQRCRAAAAHAAMRCMGRPYAPCMVLPPAHSCPRPAAVHEAASAACAGPHISAESTDPSPSSLAERPPLCAHDRLTIKTALTREAPAQQQACAPQKGLTPTSCPALLLAPPRERADGAAGSEGPQGSAPAMMCPNTWQVLWPLWLLPAGMLLLGRPPDGPGRVPAPPVGHPSPRDAQYANVGPVRMPRPAFSAVDSACLLWARSGEHCISWSAVGVRLEWKNLQSSAQGPLHSPSVPKTSHAEVVALFSRM